MSERNEKVRVSHAAALHWSAEAGLELHSERIRRTFIVTLSNLEVVATFTTRDDEQGHSRAWAHAVAFCRGTCAARKAWRGEL